MAKKRSKPELSLVEGGIHFALESEQSRVETVLSPAEALDVFLELGKALRNVVATEIASEPDPSRHRSHVTIPTTAAAAATDKNGNVIICVSSPRFPTMWLPIPDDAAKSTGQALVQIVDAPRDVRRGTKN